MISAATLSSHNSSNLARAMPLISANQLREFGFPFCGKVAQERSRAFGREQRLPNRSRADRVAEHGPHAAAIIHVANRALFEKPPVDGIGIVQHCSSATTPMSFCPSGGDSTILPLRRHKTASRLASPVDLLLRGIISVACLHAVVAVGDSHADLAEGSIVPQVGGRVSQEILGA